MKNGQQSAYPIFLQNGISHDSHVDAGLTKREYACIKLGIPETGDPELDELIRKAERKRISSMIISGITSNSKLHGSDWKIAESCIKLADELLNQLGDE